MCSLAEIPIAKEVKVDAMSLHTVRENGFFNATLLHLFTLMPSE